MIIVQYSATRNKSFFTASLKNATDFQDTIAAFRASCGTYEPDLKLHSFPVEMFQTFLENIDEMVTNETIVYQPCDAREQIENAAKTCRELKHPPARVLFDHSKLAFPPLKGKPPFEKYQSIDIMRALNQNRFLFNWEMGLGKSYALAAIIESLRRRKEIDKLVIITTKIGAGNLREELVKFAHLDPNEFFICMSVKDIPFNERGFFTPGNYPQKIFVLSYNVFRSVSNYYYDIENGTRKNPHPSTKKEYRKMLIPFDKWFGGYKGAIFLDESHYIANPKSEQSRLIRGHIHHFEYRYLFTGTFASKFEKMYPQLQVLDPSLVYHLSYEMWCTLYNAVGNKFSKYAVNPAGWRLDKLEKLNNLVLRDYAANRKMLECLDLPPDIDVPPIMLEMSDAHRELYEAFVNDYFKLLSFESKEDHVPLSTKVLTCIPAFQTAVNNPEVLINTTKFDKLSFRTQQLIRSFRYERDCQKVETLLDIIEDRVDICEEKGIVWYFHPKTGEALDKLIKTPHIVISAETKDQLFEEVQRFKKDPKIKILIASILVLNTSVTITEAKWQAYMEKTYDFDIYKQSRARINRPGQTSITQTYTMLYERSLDLLQAAILTTKGELMNRLLTRKFFTQEDWSKIFNMKRGDLI